MLHPKEGLGIRLDPRPVSKRVGLITLATDHTTERDFARICNPDEIGVYTNRIEYANPTSPENLRLTGPRLTEAAALILPDEEVDVVAYSCTAASVVLGNDGVEELIHSAKPTAQVVTPSSAAFAAFKALGIKRVSVLTPYTDEVTSELIYYFKSNGLEIVNYKCLGFDDDRKMGRITPDSVIAAGREATCEEAEALFISCTAVQAMVCIDELERLIGKPVVSSNQATIWHCLRLANITRSISGFGQLFTI